MGLLNCLYNKRAAMPDPVWLLFYCLNCFIVLILLLYSSLYNFVSCLHRLDL